MNNQEISGFDQNDLGQQFEMMKGLKDAEPLLLTKEEQRANFRQRLEQFKEELNTRIEGMDSLVQDLTEAVFANSDITLEQMTQLVQEKNKQYNFSSSELKSVMECCEYCHQVNEMVNFYTEHFSKEDLFEKCFGQKPQGAIMIYKLPASLAFAMFDPEDYVAATAKFYRGENNTLSPTQEDKKFFLSTGGMALTGCGIEGLEGCVAVYNCSEFGLSSIDEQNVTREIPEGKETTLKLDSPEMTFKNGDDQIKFKSLGFDQTSDTARFQILDKEGDPLHDIAIVLHRDNDGNIQSMGFRSASDTQSSETETFSFSHSAESGTVQIEISPSEIRLKSEKGTWTMGWQISEEMAKAVNDKVQEVAIHEEQHVLNRIFYPTDETKTVEMLVAEVSEGKRNFEDAKQYFVHSALKNCRRSLIDHMTRDEIIAYYQSSGIDSVYQMLGNSQLYDYKTILADQIGEFSSKVMHGLRTIYDAYDKSAEYIPNYGKIQEEIGKETDKVFGDEYKADLRRWVDAIKQLEDKGYSKEQIIAFLYTKQVSKWNVSARRKPKMEQINGGQNG
jgi:hypothetical protein